MIPNIFEVDQSWAGQYLEFCNKFDDLMVYHTWKFREFLVDLLGCQPRYLGVASEAGELQAVLPLMELDGPMGKVLNSLPFYGSYGGVLGSNPTATTELWREYAAQARAPGVAAATIIMQPKEKDREPPIAYDEIDTRIGQFTDLDFGDNPATGLLNRIDSSSNRNLRKAEVSGVEVMIDNGAMAQLEAIHRENMDAIGGRPKPHEFFSLVPKYFNPGQDYNLYIATHKGTAVGALLLFYAGVTVEYYVPATRLEARSLQPSAAILYRAMLDASARGMRLWNWGGTWLDQEGVLRFKRKWGAYERPYCYFITINNSEIRSTSREILLDSYPYFYVVPFNCLNKNECKEHG